MFSSYQPMSATSPVKPKGAVSMIATTIRVCPRSSRRSARRILGHHGALPDRELVEDGREEAEWSSSTIRVAHRHADGICGRDVVPHARLPRLALLHEVQRLAVDHGTTVQLVNPDVHDSGRLGPRRRRLPDADLIYVGQRYSRPRAGEHALDGRNDVRIDHRCVRRLPAEAAEGTAPIDQGTADTRALAAPRGHRPRVAPETCELDESVDDDP